MCLRCFVQETTSRKSSGKCSVRSSSPLLFFADNFSGLITHLQQRDTAMAAISRAPYGKPAMYAKQMGSNSGGCRRAERLSTFENYASFFPEQAASKKAFSNSSAGSKKERDTLECASSSRIPSGIRARGIDLVNTAYTMSTQHLRAETKGAG